MTKKFLITFLCCIIFCINAIAQTVSNVFSQQNQNTIIVSYHLETPDPCTINLFVSNNNGGTWSGPLKQVKGDVGANIAKGSRSITWNVLEEYIELKGDNIKFKVEPESNAIKVGSKYQGGIIFFIDNSGKHGLIVSPSDLGRFNWEDAKKACEYLILCDYKYWRLPTKDELNLLYLQNKLIGNFVQDFYWSSSEDGRYFVWRKSFADGQQYAGGKLHLYVARAVRSF